MKALFNSSIILLLLCILFPITSINAQSLSYEDDEYLRKNGYEMGSEYDFSLRPGDYDYVYREIYEGNDYIIITASEDGVLDLDVYLYDSDGELLVKDEDEDDLGFAFVKYSDIQSTRTMKIKVKNYESYCDDCYYDIKLWVYYR